MSTDINISRNNQLLATTTETMSDILLHRRRMMAGLDSPYSVEATAALRAVFPTQWPIIKAYGFSHPEMVGYMNTYAPEDPKIAYSLVEGIGERWVVGDINGKAFINTELAVTQNTSIAIKMKFTNINSSSQHSCLFGSRASHNSRCVTWGWGNSSWYVTGDKCFTSWGASPTYKMLTRPLDLLPHNLLLDKGAYYIDGVLIYTYTSAPFTCPYPLYIFNLKEANGLLPYGLNSDGRITDVVVKEDGVKVCEMYPFIRKINGVDTCGMIDVISGTFHKNANSTGSFTISEEPA